MNHAAPIDSRHPQGRRHAIAVAVSVIVGLAICGGVDAQERKVTVSPTHANVVSFWNDIANKTITTTSPVNVTPEEQRPAYQVDLATMHVAIYDAVNAIDGRYKAFAVRPSAPASGASIDAAASAAAYQVLRALYPNRSAQYQDAYDRRLAAIPDGEAQAKGVALGSEVATAVVALRRADGRAVDLPPYVSGNVPGAYRSPNPMPFNRHVPFIKTFSLTRIDQFRPPAPPVLDSAAYTKAFDETKASGGVNSPTRSADRFEVARFHTEPPAPFVTRNLGRFAASTADVAEAARLMALIYVVHADAIGACFEAKYFYNAWRPASAIALADTDGNDATVSDAAWKPALPTPPHPEYPAAHSCTAGGLGEVLRQYYGTRNVSYTFDSTVTGTTRHYADTDALSAESQTARIDGGMHFSFSTEAGVELGAQVARWVATHHFGPRE